MLPIYSSAPICPVARRTPGRKRMPCLDQGSDVARKLMSNADGSYVTGGAGNRDQWGMCAVMSAWLNMAFRAVVMSAGVFAVKKKFGEAQA